MSELLRWIRIFLRIEEKLNRVVDILTVLVAFQQEQGRLGSVREEVWLDNQDVMQKMNISHATLKRRRLEGVIPCTRIKGKCFYRESDIQVLLQRGFGD